MVVLVVVGLVGWGVASYDGPPDRPAAQPTPSQLPQPPGPAPLPDVNGSAGTLYPPGALDGHWRSGPLVRAAGRARPGERLTMLVRGSALAVWSSSPGRSDRRLVAYDALWVRGHRLELRPVGTDGDVGRYRWRVVGGELTLRPVSGTDGRQHRRLLGRTFSRA